jgi:Na+-driven multidrug efflux pump
LGVPLCVVGGLVLGLPPFALYIIIYAEEASKSFLLLPRLNSGEWIKNLVH